MSREAIVKTKRSSLLISNLLTALRGIKIRDLDKALGILAKGNRVAQEITRELRQR